MPVKWRYLCCLCDSTDSKRRASARYECTTRQQNNRRGVNSSKNTWTRRSLLDNEQSQLNEIPYDQMGYQMRAISTAAYDNADHSFQRNLMDHFAPRKRPTVHGIFENSINEYSSSKTTFPWMDERFMPNGRTGTRLGISSIQIKTNLSKAMVPSKSPQEPSNSIPSPTSPTHTFVSSMNSQSFTDGQHLAQHDRSVVNSNNFSKHIKHIQNGNVLGNKISTASKVATNINTPVLLGVSSSDSNKPMLFKAPTTDVGVKRLGSHSQFRQDSIPKLEDYTGFCDAGYAENDHHINTDHRSTVIDIFPGIFLNTVHDTTEETNTDISFSSEVTFRKQPSEYSGNNESLKHSSSPGMFSLKTNTYERSTLQSTKSKANSKYANDTSSESMYGYVPKIVQNVHASNALEGNTIDDFFLQRVNDRHLENFGSLNRGNKCLADVEPIIITSIIESIDDLTVTANRMVNEHRGAIESPTTNTRLENTYIPNEGHLHKYEYSSPSVVSMTTVSSNTTSTSNNKQLKTNDVREETEVIMIDFPPNMENDKQLTSLTNLKTPPSSLVSVGSDPTAMAKCTCNPPSQQRKPNSQVNMKTKKDNLSAITIGEVLY